MQHLRYLDPVYLYPSKSMFRFIEAGCAACASELFLVNAWSFLYSCIKYFTRTLLCVAGRRSTPRS